MVVEEVDEQLAPGAPWAKYDEPCHWLTAREQSGRRVRADDVELGAVAECLRVLHDGSRQ
jgi:hypothetical protein